MVGGRAAAAGMVARRYPGRDERWRAILRKVVLRRTLGRRVKGDRVEVVVDAGDGVRVYEVEATRAGRRVEITTGRGLVEVTEVTRGGQSVRTARFMASRVLALVEHPARERILPDERN